MQKINVDKIPTITSHGLSADEIANKNCENFIGAAQVPIGLAGPLLIGDSNLEYLLPIATTEGALVASVNRGCKAIHQVGGCQVILENKGMSRSPVFRCPDGKTALVVKNWLTANYHWVDRQAKKTSAHITLISIDSQIRGRNLYVRFSFDTDQAMGMNMVTIATSYLANKLQVKFPEINLIALSSNYCTDKKPALVNALLGRGKWVQVEVVLSEQIISSTLKTTAAKMWQVHVAKNLVGSNLAGSFSQNAQVANVMAGIFLATGQDLAHVIDASLANLSMELMGKDLYVSLTLPSLAVGLIGGGTGLPTQREAITLMANGHQFTANDLAIVIAGGCLAGEISLIAALAADHLAKAHQRLGRGK